MTHPRRATAGLAVWLVGLGIGSLLKIQPPSHPVVSTVSVAGNTFQVLAADLHVHSFPGDGTLLPWDAAAEARQRGIDAIALTNHNHTLQWQLLSALRSWMPADVIVLAGEEVTSPGFHIAAVGIRHRVPWSRSPMEVINGIHEAEGLAIAAHPGSGDLQAYDEQALRALDGVEAAHPMKEGDDRRRKEIEAFYARARAIRPSIAAIGSSDFHREAPIGANRTFVFVTERSESGILDAVRGGRTAACDPEGHIAGAQPWSSLAADACRDAMAQSARPPAQAGGLLNAFAVGCALIGLVAMIDWRLGRGTA